MSSVLQFTFALLFYLHCFSCLFVAVEITVENTVVVPVAMDSTAVVGDAKISAEVPVNTCSNDLKDLSDDDMDEILANVDESLLFSQSSLT